MVARGSSGVRGLDPAAHGHRDGRLRSVSWTKTASGTRSARGARTRARPGVPGASPPDCRHAGGVGERPPTPRRALLEPPRGRHAIASRRPLRDQDDPQQPARRRKPLSPAGRGGEVPWASTFFSGPRECLAAAGGEAGEKMAVIIQEVVGRRHADRFYPDLSGSRAREFLCRGDGPSRRGHGEPALGLGKTIVDGGVVWSYSPRDRGRIRRSPRRGTFSRPPRHDSGP